MLLEEGVLVVYVHPHRGLVGNDGGSCDLWPGREVTQRLIYFTGVPLPASSPLSLSLLASTAHHRGALFVAREGPAADIVPHTRPVSRLYTRLHRIYMRKESILSSSSSFSTPFHPRIQRLIPRPRYDPSQGAPRCSLQCKHGSSLSPGSLYFKGHGARLFTLVPRHFGHDPPPPLFSYCYL